MRTHFPWSSQFTEINITQPGLSRQQAIDSLMAACLPLTEQEIQGIDKQETNPFPKSDPMHAMWTPSTARDWVMPTPKAFPPDYLSLLEWSNGGVFLNESFRFAQLYSVSDIRDTMLSYLTPQCVPGLLPIAMDGGGSFHFLDLRHITAQSQSCPVLTIGAGALDIDDASETYPSLWEAVTGQPITA